MELSEDFLFQSLKQIIKKARERFFDISSTLLLSYWLIAQLIVEDEQNGQKRATYGKYTLKSL